MHDPMCVAFEIRRPWPKRQARTFGKERWRFKGAFWNFAGRGYYWPGLITVWHVEPDGHDSGTVCKYRDHWKHPHHWRLQVHPLQHLRRWALTRCAWCGGRSRKDDRVNISHQWDGPRGKWWQGEPGLFHQDCSSIHNAHAACLCENGIYESELSGWGYGECARCGKRREWRSDDRRDAPTDTARRILASIPEGQRDPAKSAEVRALWAEYREHERAS
jgi:hypothetical protein